MKTYLIDYDLKSGQDYTPLYQALKKLGEHWHCLDSTWIVKSNSSASAIRDYLWGQMYSNDRLLVIQIKGCEAAWNGFTAQSSEWLKASL